MFQKKYKGLEFQHSTSITLSMFVDSDWVSDFDDRQLLIPVSIWVQTCVMSLKKQAIVSRSHTETEYRTIFHQGMNNNS